MGAAVVALVLLFLFLLFFWRLSRKKEDRGYSPIPGPRGFPIVGNALQIHRIQHITMCKWGKQYGPIFQVNLLNTKMVVLSDPKLVREAFSQLNFAGRIDLSHLNFVESGGKHGVALTEGKQWEEQRRFTLKYLKDYGLWKLEGFITMEVNELIEQLVGLEGSPVSNIKHLLTLATINSLWHIVSGKRYNQDDAVLRDLSYRALNVGNELVRRGALFFFLPWLAMMFPGVSGFSKFRKAIGEYMGVIRVEVKEHLESYREENARDFIDSYIREINATKESTSSFYGNSGIDNLHGVLADLYMAGTETTANTLSWMILYLGKFQAVQTKLQEEIGKVTGGTRQCTLADKPRMPYAEAVIHETLRLSSVFPMGVQHRALLDQEFRGHMILKDTIIAANMYFIHHNPEVWGDDAESFRPERFLSSDGTRFIRNEALIPFSTGRRQCLGETLGRDSLFLFSTNIFQRFHVQFPEGHEPGLGFINGAILSPKDFDVIFKDRMSH